MIAVEFFETVLTGAAFGIGFVITTRVVDYIINTLFGD